MKREEFNQCLGQGMRGKKLTKEERKLEFCAVAKVCSGKSRSREDALEVCRTSLSQPREPKVRGKRKGAGQSCEKDTLKLAHCAAERIDMNLASNVNSIEAAIANALMECSCQRE